MASHKVSARGYTGGGLSVTKILLVLSFLLFTFAHVNGLPNRAPADSEFTWSPKISEDDVDLRSLSYGNRAPTPDESQEFDDEYDLNDVDFDNEDDGYFEHRSILNNKRSPNSADHRSFKNKAGYYLVEGPNHTITGTRDITKCNKNGVFQVGKTRGVPFVKNTVSGWYLAIDDAGAVYMTDQPSPETVIRVKPYRSVGYLYLYRIVKNPTKKRYYLSITPQSSIVPIEGNAIPIDNTTIFRYRFGKAC